MILRDKFMNCHDVKNKLQLFFDGELDEKESSEFASHISQCEKCQHEIAILKQIDSAGKEEIFSQPEADYWSALSADIMKKIKKNKSHVSILESFRQFFESIHWLDKINYHVAGLATAAAIVLIVVVVIFFEHGKFKFLGYENKIVMPEAPLNVPVYEFESDDLQESIWPEQEKKRKPKKKSPQAPNARNPKVEESIEDLKKSTEYKSLINVPALKAPILEEKKLSVTEKQREGAAAAEMSTTKIQSLGNKEIDIEQNKKLGAEFHTQSIKREKDKSVHFLNNEVADEQLRKSRPAQQFNLSRQSKGIRNNYNSTFYDYESWMSLAEQSKDPCYKLAVYDSVLKYEKNPDFRCEVIFRKLVILINIAKEEKTDDSINNMIGVYDDNYELLRAHNKYEQIKQQVDVLKKILKREKK